MDWLLPRCKAVLHFAKGRGFYPHFLMTQLQKDFIYDITQLRANLHILDNNGMKGSALACAIARYFNGSDG